ncbi:glycosyltransferase family 2 protein [Lonepinella sp. MS14435]|uniref:glycosyltransferase family 2 protein n=1 Tax=unclassified Lonepinella TaxID=2642006 RepID=UPI0036DBCBF2
MNKSICAVVVTYNRKQQLLACLNALKKQSYTLAHIVVVNNASQDGTEDFLIEHNWTNNENFTLLNLTENLGGAGGFYTGIEFAYQQKFDYIWLMDDDGMPTEHCLSGLCQYLSDDIYIGPLVLDIDEPQLLTFTLRLPRRKTVLSTISDVEKQTKNGIIPNIVMPFNGILFSRHLVEQIGLPKKEYFIWGDDMEYTWRAAKFGFKIFTVTNATFYHPREKTLGTPMFFNLLKFNDTESALKLYCMCRNNIRNLLEYKGYLITGLYCIKVMWFYLFTKPNRSRLKTALRGLYHGLTKNFTQHIGYLK